MDDVLNSGMTAHAVCNAIIELNPSRITIVFLARKRGVHHSLQPDFCLFEVDASVWTVGHGMDYLNNYRHLSGIFDARANHYDRHGRRLTAIP